MGGRLPGQCGRHPIGSEENASGRPHGRGVFPDIPSRAPSLCRPGFRSPNPSRRPRAEIPRRG